MRIVLIFLSLLCAQLSRAESLVGDSAPLTGRDYLMPLTHLCSADHFHELYQTFDKHHLIDQKVIPVKVVETKNGVSTADGKISATYSKHLYALTFGGKTYSSSDACDVLVQGSKSFRSHAFLQVLVPKAFGLSDMALNDDPTNSYLLGGALVVGGSAAGFFTSWTGVGLYGGGLAVAAGVGMLTGETAMRSELKKLQSVLNDDVKLSCSGGWVKIIGKTASINLKPAAGNLNGHELDFVKGGKQEKLTFYGTRLQVGYLLRSLVNNCKNDADAKRIEKDMRSDEFRTDLMLKTNQHDNDAINHEEQDRKNSQSIH